MQDGAIIGDGRSDFTLKTQSYSFQYNHQNFVLLDVPGIEGSEQKVIDQISNATQKAHAIFMLPKRLILRKKEKKGKGERLKKSKDNSVCKQRYGRFSTNRLIAQEL
ncbi:hypothetical protein E5E22_03500 [Helicobacter pylori]|uniref:hypothetical protein n=1 Tax=Helicobacter pylori TaxID=210 RepID=UPI001E3AE785|nr:hypothetical protein [Helicobacter pylori]WRG37569.1 hypothetical protein E5E22_03500 [Helicobacter pylori]